MVMTTQALEVARNGPPTASRIGRIELGDVVELAPVRGHRTTREPAVTVDGPHQCGQSRSRSIGQRAGRRIGLGAMPIRSSNDVRGSRDQPLHRPNPIPAAVRFATWAITSGDKRQDSRNMLPTRSVPRGLGAEIDEQGLSGGISGELASKIRIDRPVSVDARGI